MSGRARWVAFAVVFGVLAAGLDSGAAQTAPRNAMPATSTAEDNAAADVGAAAAAPDEPPSKTFGPEDCKRLPGGNAPLNRLTRMVGAMAVKNLELTYLGKPLHKLAEEDFADLAGLLEQCKEVDSKLAAFQSRRLKALIEDAKTTRAVSLEWFEDVRIEVLQMSGRSDDIRRLHDLMTELNNRQFEMTPADLRKYFAWLAERRDALYAEAAKRVAPARPFDPGPTSPSGSN